MQQIEIPASNEKAFQMEHFHLCDLFMVHHIDSRWHQIMASITSMRQKLMELGFVYYNDEIHIIEPVEKQSYV